MTDLFSVFLSGLWILRTPHTHPSMTMTKSLSRSGPGLLSLGKEGFPLLSVAKTVPTAAARARPATTKHRFMLPGERRQTISPKRKAMVSFRTILQKMNKMCLSGQRFRDGPPELVPKGNFICVMQINFQVRSCRVTLLKRLLRSHVQKKSPSSDLFPVVIYSSGTLLHVKTKFPSPHYIEEVALQSGMRTRESFFERAQSPTTQGNKTQ